MIKGMNRFRLRGCAKQPGRLWKSFPVRPCGKSKVSSIGLRLARKSLLQIFLRFRHVRFLLSDLMKNNASPLPMTVLTTFEFHPTGKQLMSEEMQNIPSRRRNWWRCRESDPGHYG